MGVPGRCWRLYIQPAPGSTPGTPNAMPNRALPCFASVCLALRYKFTTIGNPRQNQIRTLPGRLEFAAIEFAALRHATRAK